MKRVVLFEDGVVDKELLGNKGANLVTMYGLGLPVPPGFIFTIESFEEHRSTGRLPEGEMDQALSRLIDQTGRDFGNGLLVSVRSSAPVSMPGMMDTILNVQSREHMLECIAQVFASWNSSRAREYRELNGISADLGTSAVVQLMVLGDRDPQSGTGVVFSRNPNTGDRGLFGEYLRQAQGEDLVSGVRTPENIDALRAQSPEIYTQLEELVRRLEGHFTDMQDVEFTVESGRLYLLQTRTGKRSGPATIKIAVDMVVEGLIAREEAISRVSPDDLRAMLHNRIRLPERYEPLARGLNAAPGAISGNVVFDPDEAVVEAKRGEAVILVRPETSPDDIRGIAAAQGVLTSKGGLTSHAAIVTRAMGKSCVCGAEDMKVDLEKARFTVGKRVVQRGDSITIDGTSGNVYLGVLPLLEAEATPELAQLLEWADDIKEMGVWGNAETPEGVALARRYGAQGIGLCRTERQFSGAERLKAIRRFILSDTDEEREQSLAALKRLQKEDFVALFHALAGMPVIIRLLDLPLHEFLPQDGESSDRALSKRLEELKEINPMLGHRGVRVAVTAPDIYLMQVEAISEAMAEVQANVNVMVPQVITLQELLWVKRHIEAQGLRVGVMMETVRACMRAGKLAQEAGFFSFGTNDLTQAVYSFSREDAEKKFLSTYLDDKLLDDNPFEVIDVKGVGRLMETAIHWARLEEPSLEIGVCGEHAGEPRSVSFFHDIGVTYVSCSPYRIPVAKLMAAQAAIRNPRTADRPSPFV